MMQKEGIGEEENGDGQACQSHRGCLGYRDDGFPSTRTTMVAVLVVLVMSSHDYFKIVATVLVAQILFISLVALPFGIRPTSKVYVVIVCFRKKFQMPISVIRFYGD